MASAPGSAPEPEPEPEPEPGLSASAPAAPRPRPELPSPPFIDVPGLPNLRDIGGYPIDDRDGGDGSSDSDYPDGKPAPKKKMVRRGIVFRSSEPSRLTEAGEAVLRTRLGVARVFDLRSAVEIERTAAATGGEGWHVREIDGAERVFVPVFLDQDYSPEALALRMRNYSGGVEGFVRAYSTILESAADPAHPYQPFPTILAHLAAAPPAPPPAPILVHCTAGKDRTGIICALLLSLCGVADDAVAHEYALTDAGLAERKDELVAHLMRHESMRDNRQGAENMVASRKENMLATLDLIRKTYGSVEKYLMEKCRLSAADVAQIRRNLIVDVDDGENKPIDWRSHEHLTR